MRLNFGEKDEINIKELEGQIKKRKYLEGIIKTWTRNKKE
jgi:hypothetical protein